LGGVKSLRWGVSSQEPDSSRRSWMYPWFPGSHQQSKCVSYTSRWLQSSDTQTRLPRCPPHAGMGKPTAIESVVCLLENPVK
ncbi:hypothetical protein DBR06_SOUSAS11710072, partial [Sousa chinensis]